MGAITLLMSDDKCKMFLHSYLPETNARASRIHHLSDAMSFDTLAISVVGWSVIIPLTYLNVIVKLLTVAFQRNLTVISLTIDASSF